MLASIAAALAQGLEIGVHFGLALAASTALSTLPDAQEPDVAETESMHHTPAQERLRVPAPVARHVLGAPPAPFGAGAMAAPLGTSGALQDRTRSPRYPRTSVAGHAGGGDGAPPDDSDVYGIPFQSMARGRANISVTILPPPSQWASGPNNSIQAEILISTPTSFAEKFFVQIPLPLPATPQPLLVVFHKFGSSQLDVVQNTRFPDEANARGWFLVCPLGASKKHFSSIESQGNTEAVFQWLLAAYGARIDLQRLYGVGFSMGGGAVANYAARHLDPARPMFAAIVNHSGGVALNNTYFHEIPIVRQIFDFWFGDGSVGSADPWKMARSSVVDFDPVTLVASTDNDLARNLMHVPLQIKRAKTDVIDYINDQTEALHQHMLNLGKVPGPDYSFEFIPKGHESYGHSWGMLDFGAVCDWLAQYTLQVPTSANTLADRDDVYFHFLIEQDAPGAFTPFSWSVDGGANALVLDDTSNLARVTVATLAAGLDPAQTLSVTIGTTDGLPDEIVLTQVPFLPSAVLRDSVPVSVDWSYAPVAQTLTISETDGGAHVWQIVP